MRRIFAVILVLLCLISRAEAKPRLAVRQFTDASEEGKAPAGAVMHMMVTELTKAGVFDLMERENLNYIADEIALGQSGLMDPSTAPAVGKVKGVQYQMTGAITMYYYDEKGSGIMIPIFGGATQKKNAYVVLEIRIMDSATGEILYASDQLGTANQVMKGALATYKGFFIGGYSRQSGGMLGQATREAVLKHVAAIKAQHWEE